MKSIRLHYLLLVLLILSASAQTLYAQKQPALLNDAQVTERLSYIENALYTNQPHAQAWWYSWMAIYGSATIVQGTLAGLHWEDWKHDNRRYPTKVRNRGFAEDMLIGACTTTLGVGGLLITPFKSAYLPDRLRAMPSGTAAERAAKLQQAEDILRQCAEVVNRMDGGGFRMS